MLDFNSIKENPNFISTMKLFGLSPSKYFQTCMFSLERTLIKKVENPIDVIAIFDNRLIVFCAPENKLLKQLVIIILIIVGVMTEM